MSVRNGAMAKYVEGCISFNDMKAFFCENKDDSNLTLITSNLLFSFVLNLLCFSIVNELMRVLREEKRLGVNVVHSPPSNQPLTSEFQPRVAITELK